MTTRKQPVWAARARARERNREALLRACADLAVERGYARTSVDAIATLAGLTKGAVYSIFGSKPALFREMMRPEWGFPLPSEVAPQATSLIEAVEAIAVRMWQSAADPRARGILLMQLELYVDLGTQPQEWARFDEEFRLRIDQLARELQDFGVLRRPATVVALSLVGSMNGLSQLVALGVADVDVSVFIDAAKAVVLP